MEANDMLCYSNSAKMQPFRVNVDKHERTFLSYSAKIVGKWRQENKERIKGFYCKIITFNDPPHISSDSLKKWNFFSLVNIEGKVPRDV